MFPIGSVVSLLFSSRPTARLKASLMFPIGREMNQASARKGVSPGEKEAFRVGSGRPKKAKYD